MEDSFQNFINQIPSDIHVKTETNFDAKMVIFRPQSFVIGVEAYFHDYHILLPTSNPPPLRIERQVHQFKKGKLLPFAPETRMLNTEYAPSRPYIAMNIKRDFLQQIARDAIGITEVSFSRMNNPYSSKLVNLICIFEEELKNSQYQCPLMLQSISTQIAIQILRETGNDNNVKKKKLPIDRNYVNQAKEYMIAFYNGNIKIEDICKEIHLSPYHFMRMFKAETGQSSHEFLLSLRVGKAEEMLRIGNYSIEEVARLCGFVSSAHFSNHFKRVRGIPPSEYKRKYFIMKK